MWNWNETALFSNMYVLIFNLEDCSFIDEHVNERNWLNTGGMEGWNVV